MGFGLFAAATDQSHCDKEALFLCARDSVKLHSTTSLAHLEQLTLVESARLEKSEVQVSS